jgi:hypothetical protein
MRSVGRRSALLAAIALASVLGSSLPTLLARADPIPDASTTDLAVVQLASNGAIDIYNAMGATDVVLDLVGWYAG